MAVEHDLARPTLEMVRAVKTLAPTPAAGNGKGTNELIDPRVTMAPEPCPAMILPTDRHVWTVPL